jgi:hypothetical protein
MTSKTGRIPGTRTTQTQYRLSVLANFIEENNRIPEVEEVQELLGIENVNTARNYLKMIKTAIPDPDSILGEIQGRLLARIKERLGDKDNPMNDSDAIKLLEFFMPKKSESKQTIEEVKVIGDAEQDELAQYRKILLPAEGGDAPPL